VETVSVVAIALLLVVPVASLHLITATDLKPASSQAEWGVEAFGGDDSFADPALPDVPAASLVAGEQVDQPDATSNSPQLSAGDGSKLSEAALSVLAEQRQQELAKLQQRANARGATMRRLRDTPVQIRMAVFNILGSNHTGPGSRYASGRTRAGWAAGVVDDFDVVGFSEIQVDQLGVMNSSVGGSFDFYPGTALGNAGVPTNLMWRASRFEMVDAGSVSIPFVGQRRLMPYVRLRDKASKKEFWVMNAHNAPRGRQSERDAAVSIEISKLRELVATGLPVFFMGDLNEKATVFCKVTGALPMAAANGGSTGGGCSMPGGAKIDWIFGTTAQVSFSGYSQTKGGIISRITDHHLVSATASVK
jgi:endonuclease/exonuclease/phosphatase family metal-dependent hydrolase